MFCFYEILNFKISPLFLNALTQSNCCMAKSFFVKTNGKYQRVLIDDIYYIEASGHYIRIVTEHGCFVAHLKLSQIEELIPRDLFCRIHRSYIVAIDKIHSFDHEQVYIKKMELPVSAQFFEALKNKAIIIHAGGGGNNNEFPSLDDSSN